MHSPHTLAFSTPINFMQIKMLFNVADSNFSSGLTQLNVPQANRYGALKSLNHGKQTKWNQLGEKVPICRGSLAWLGRQTHNLENINGGQTPMSRSRGLEAKIKRESRSRHHLFLMLLPHFCGEFRQQIVGYLSG